MELATKFRQEEAVRFFQWMASEPGESEIVDDLSLIHISLMGMILTWVGASQVGKAPAKCSIKMPINRSMLPNTTRWIICLLYTSRCV